MEPGARIAHRYVAAMNAGDAEGMLALFAPDAVLRHPSGVYENLDAIRGFFVEMAFANRARLEEIALHAEARMAWLEVEAISDVTPGRQRIVDVFRLDAEGRIVDLGVYAGNTTSARDL